jgi:DNA-binding CsgD family transcriptional regulator
MLHITPSELEALQLLAVGATTDHIADRLRMNRSEVESLVQALMVRMGTASEHDAIAAARRRGLIALTG